MRKSVLSIILFIFMSSQGLAIDLSVPSTSASPTASPSKTAQDPFAGALLSTPAPDKNGNTKELLKFERSIPKEAETGRMTDRQEFHYESGDRNIVTQQKDRDAGNARAQQMMTLIKDDQMKKAMEKATGIGNNILKENPGLKTPAALIAGAASFWYGRTIKLIKGESFGVTSHVEGKTQSGGFSMDSPLFNGKLNYKANDGMDVSVNRRISSISSQAEVKYNATNKGLSTQVRHNLMPHVDLTFGSTIMPQSSQPDNRAAIEYGFSF